MWLLGPNGDTHLDGIQISTSSLLKTITESDVFLEMAIKE